MMCVVPSDPTRIELELVTSATQPIVENLLQLFIHDLSQFRFTRPDASGRFHHDARYSSFFSDPDRCAYLLRVGDSPVGFGLIRGLKERPHVMAAFFIARGVRRQKLGQRAAIEMLRRHPGVWEIPFQEENIGAARFWRELAELAAGHEWSEETRPVPMKPHIPDDVWITLNTAHLTGS